MSEITLNDETNAAFMAALVFFLQLQKRESYIPYAFTV
jgi:hypothetical protein